MAIELLAVDGYGDGGEVLFLGHVSHRSVGSNEGNVAATFL